MSDIADLNKLMEQLEYVKTNSEIESSRLFAEKLNDNDLYKSEPFFVASNMRLNSSTRLGKEFMPHWNKETSLAMILYYIDEHMMSSIIHKDILMFYKKDELKELSEETFGNETYAVLGIKKPRVSDNPKLNDLFKDAKVSSWCVVKTYDELTEAVEKYTDDDLHIFKMSDVATDTLLEQFKNAYTLSNYQIEKNCFDMSPNANNDGKYKVHMKGDIIITDPCYLIKHRDESTRPKWADYHLYGSIYEYPDYDADKKESKMFSENAKKLYEADEKWCQENPDDRDYWDETNLSPFGFTTYLTHNTLYGDWGCTTFDSNTNKPIGEFCADGGEVGVFLLDEVLKYNPEYTDYKDENMQFTVTLIKDFDGEVWFEKVDSETLIVRGEGNVNFYTRQTSL